MSFPAFGDIEWKKIESLNVEGFVVSVDQGLCV